MSKRSLLMGLAGRIKNPFTIVVAETFNTTHRIRSYDPMALRLIQKVSVLFSLRHSLTAAAVSSRHSLRHYRRSSVDYDVIYAFKPPPSLISSSLAPALTLAAAPRTTSFSSVLSMEAGWAMPAIRLYFIIGLGLHSSEFRMKARHHHHFK